MVFAILLGKLWGGKIQTFSERQRPPSAAWGPGLGTSGPCDLHTPTASTSASETAPDFGVNRAEPPAKPPAYGSSPTASGVEGASCTQGWAEGAERGGSKAELGLAGRAAELSKDISLFLR